MSEANPIVSVVMITYMHEQFIADAINGVLMQEVAFPVELIVADDCSPDNTEKIVKSFESHPNYSWIKHTRHSLNKGMMSNFIWSLEQSKGKYIALCEGDDYWTDPLKLQKQVGFLENNQHYSLCFHIATIIEQGKQERIFNSYNRENYSSVDLFSTWLIPTASAVFRNIKMSYPDWFRNGTHGDLGLFLLLGEHGPFYFINQTMSTYRLSDTGVTRSDFNTVRHKKAHITQIEGMIKYFGGRWDNPLNERLIGYTLSTAYLSSKNNDTKEALLYLGKAVRTRRISMYYSKYFYATLFYILKNKLRCLLSKH